MTAKEFLLAWSNETPIYDKNGKVFVPYQLVDCDPRPYAYTMTSGQVELSELSTEKPAKVINLVDSPPYSLHLFPDGSFKFGHKNSRGEIRFHNDPQVAYDGLRSGNFKNCIDALVELVRKNC